MYESGKNDGYSDGYIEGRNSVYVQHIYGPYSYHYNSSGYVDGVCINIALDTLASTGDTWIYWNYN